MSTDTQHLKTDKSGYDAEYKGREIAHSDTLEVFVDEFDRRLRAFRQGGGTKGHVRRVATDKMLAAARALHRPNSEITVLDAGSGLGGLSIYLAAKGFRVYGIDISDEGCRGAQRLAEHVGIGDQCTFLARSLESTSLPDHSIDLIIGHASLHHFIKYEGVPAEFRRILKPKSQGFFADSFGENKAFHLFHDKEKMCRLGDVSLTRRMIIDYFDGFDVEILPTDWFVMLDKLYLRLAHGRAQSFLRSMSSVHFWLDRQIPATSRLALGFSGAVVTSIRKKD